MTNGNHLDLPEPADETGFPAPYAYPLSAAEGERPTGTLADAVRRHVDAQGRSFRCELDELDAEVQRDRAEGPEERRRAQAVLGHARQELRLAQLDAEAAGVAAQPFYLAVGSALRGHIQAVVGFEDRP